MISVRKIFKFANIAAVFHGLKWAGIIGLGGGMLYILYCAVRDPQIVHKMLGDGIMPRILSWGCLIYGSYGLARARVSVTVAMIFFMAAMFFAYAGPYVPFIKNYY